MESIPSENPQNSWQLPKKQGLYDPENEHEACGVGFIVAIDGKRSHKVSLDVHTPKISKFSYFFFARFFEMRKHYLSG